MFERSELALKVLCGLVAGLVVYRLGLIIVHINPLAHVTIPALPSLPSASVTVAAGAGSNSLRAPAKSGTNATHEVSASKGTNAIARSSNAVGHASNTVAHATNSVAGRTNAVAQATNTIGHATNSIAQATNSFPGQLNAKPGATPSGSPQLAGMGMPPGAFPGMPPGGMPPGAFPGMPKPGPPLSPEIQARLDRIIDSEILAPVMRPLPMALLGIAGKDIFLRAPNGQTGLIKEGEELGGVKLVRIGINRVLVEEHGEQKELTVFAGLGSESLLSTKKDSPK